MKTKLSLILIIVVFSFILSPVSLYAGLASGGNRGKSVARRPGSAKGVYISSPCTVYDFVVTAVTAKDFAFIHDGNINVAANLVLELEVGVAGDTKIFSFPNGIDFSTNVSADVTDEAVDLSIIYSLN